jgi:anti-sigma factor RsiW
MNHDEAVQLLGPYLDGEPDLGICLQLEEHLAGCTDCQQKLAGAQELVGLIQSEAPRFKAPPFLKTRIRAILREEKSAPATMSWLKHFSVTWTLSGLAVVTALLVILTSDLSSTQEIPALAQEGVSNHVRSLQVNHLMDVASTDQHTVKPWFAGKLDYSPQVVDLGPSGFPLIGGRLDVMDARNVAALIYQHRKHYINLFVWPANAQSLNERLYTKNGYHVLCWTRSGMNYVAVSELGEKEFRDFVAMVQDQTTDSLPEKME